MRRGTLLALLAALGGLVLAAAITLAADRLSSQRIGLSAEPLTAGEELVPTATPAAHARRTAEGTPTVTPRRTAGPTNTSSATPTATPTATSDESGSADDGGSGRGRGRGRGRGSDDDD
jgi:hypothetical protein